MKNKIYIGLITLALFVVAACDNKNTDVEIIDGPPIVTLGSPSGLVRGETFTIEVTATDGIEGSTISTLNQLDWDFTNGGGSGSQRLSGDNAIAVIAQDGLDVGPYTLTVRATDSNGNVGESSVDFDIASDLFDITGDWSIEPVAGAFKVGPAAGSGEWWQIADGDIAPRACHFDDVYTFNADGSFHIDMQDETWLEAFQGVTPDQCGTPVSPFVSSTAFTYGYTGTTLTLTGRGAAVALAKVNNAGEISNGAPVADEITYNITSLTDDGTDRRMTLQIEAGAGVWWEFLLISGPGAGVSEPAPIEGTWKMAPEEGALAVGPTAGSNAWWQNNAADVTARDCFFDDTWTFDAAGNMTIDMGTGTWLETWQGVAEGCGTPLAPFESGTYTYSLSGDQLTVDGTGAFVGLQKVHNNGELAALGDAVSSITYTVSEITETTMTIQINYNPGGDGWWQYKLVKE